MSDSISSASQTISTQLTEISVNTLLNIRYLLLIIVILIIAMFYISSLFTMSLTTVAKQYSNTNKINTLKFQQHDCSIANADTTEYFSQVSSSSYVDFQSIPLTAPDSSLNYPLHLMFGQADRHINDDKYTLKISSNLYVLDGNIFNQNKNGKQSYNAYLMKKDNSKLKIGDLKKDGDGLYKLTFSSQDRTNLETYKYVAIFYNDETPLLVGGFS